MRSKLLRFLAIVTVGSLMYVIPAISSGITFIKPVNGQVLTSTGQVKINTSLTSSGSWTLSDNGTDVCVNIRSMYCKWPTTATSSGNHTLSAISYDNNGAVYGTASISVSYTGGGVPSPTPIGTPIPTPSPTPTPTSGVISFKLIDNVSAFVGTNGSWGSSYYAFSKAALQNEANALAPFYNPKGIKVYGFGEAAPSNAWPMTVQSSCILGSTVYAAYHFYTGTHLNGQPYGCIQATPSQGGGYWWMTRAMEHELAEMMGDPFPNTGDGNIEIVDPVAQYFGMVDPSTLVFTFAYTPAEPNWPFTDFELPLANQISTHYMDYLQKVIY